MKYLIAPDSFKENLNAMEVATAIEQGILKVSPKARIHKTPMADGGEGTVQSLIDATGGRILKTEVVGPLGEKVMARFGILGDQKTAVIEMAEASGLPLVPKDKRDPMLTTTYGVGELIRAALDEGVEELIIGIGGSATVDGGAGMAQALGVRFLDAEKGEIPLYASGGVLERIVDVDMSGLDPRIAKAKIRIACDVDNPLSGKKGAAAVFGPQKGATPEMVKRLDANLKHLGEVLFKKIGKDVRKIPGGGAAGGLGAGLVAFTGANMQSGVELVIDAVDLRNFLADADVVITGEGRVDFQTAFGKTPAGVAKCAAEFGVPVIAIGGGLADDARGVYEHGIDGLESATVREMTLKEALENSAKYLENAGERVARLLEIGRRIEKRRRKGKKKDKEKKGKRKI